MELVERLLVLGAGAGQLGLLGAARSRGLFVIAVDRDPGAPGFRHADRRAIVSVEDDKAPRELEWATLLLVGADTVFHDGTLCNKAGTRELAEAAADESVPALVACEVIKLAPINAADAPAAPEFDLTPPELIDRVVTEEGAYLAEEIRALVDRTPFLRDGYSLLGL